MFPQLYLKPVVQILSPNLFPHVLVITLFLCSPKMSPAALLGNAVIMTSQHCVHASSTLVFSAVPALALGNGWP